ncbi:alginate export family protein [Desulforegula conservatrix]|uniref:alginate export family protein n=1 Tax=Desulforegula conservatrix TaxID=153026 RepID=UPI00041D3AD9|nr:alginate export family protein [Desulforegula conservatrix]
MKRFCSVLLASAVVASAVPAMAFENQFGGYWRTRAFTQRDFAADEKADSSRTDSRTRLYYTAEFSKNFKLVNKFEMDAIWGSKEYFDRPAAANKPGSGAIGADSISVEVKNTYADFAFDLVNDAKLGFKLGTQGTVISRGFLFNDDFSGAIVSYDMNKDIKIPFIWIKANEGGPGINTAGDKLNDEDIDVYALSPEFKLGKAAMINPLFAYQKQESTNSDIYTMGLNADMTADAFKAWFTGIYQNGTIMSGTVDMDLASYLVALGAEYNIGKLNLNAQGFYASGDDDATDDEMNGFVGFANSGGAINAGQDYHWSEIMGGGIFDSNVSNGIGKYGYNSVTNITAAKIGASYKAMDKLTVYGDIWYAKLSEVAKGQDDELGTEFDLRARYMLFENLALDVVGAYLAAGDATNKDDNPYEVGTQLELKF